MSSAAPSRPTAGVDPVAPKRAAPCPFAFDAGRGPVVGRSEESARVLRALTAGERLAIVGRRGIGKRTLVAAASGTIRPDEVVVLRVEGRHVASVLDFARWVTALLFTVASEEHPSTAHDHLHRWVSAQGEQLWLPLDGGWVPLPERMPVVRTAKAAWRQRNEWSRPSMDYVRRTTLRVLAGIRRAALERERRACLIVEDADVMVRALGPEGASLLVELLRDLLAPTGGVGLLLLAQQVDGLGPLATLVGASVTLGTPARAAMLDLLDNTFSAGGVALDDGVLYALLAEADELPAAVQRLAGACWEASMRSGSESDAGPRLMPDMVRAAANTVARQLDSLHGVRWASLTLLQRAVVRAVRRHRGEGLLGSTVCEKMDIQASSMHRALASLTAAELLWREKGGDGSVRFCFVDPSFGDWLDTRAG